jgi:hypothetical protein
MTWASDQSQGRAEGQKREQLLAEREKIEQQIRALKATPLNSNSHAAFKGRQDDLLELARKIVLIDKKLGRIV